ncbi:venom allergen 5.01 [Drosophila hydei]|uniref:Venom allergen 5.01 n=1 Tax=Drosophila hydei TaxID=7224 RepID=A0A6J1MIK1_DROHY|nr:venom allergen 5.01 [Drosophila hydei]
MRYNLILQLLGLQLVVNMAASKCAHQIFCPPHTKHVMCAFTKKFNKRCGAGKFELIPIDGDLKDNLLTHVNMMRSLVASGLYDFPPAARMATLMWDESLASSSRTLAYHCDSRGKYCSNTMEFNFVSTVEISLRMHPTSTVKLIFDDLVNIWLRDVLGCRMNEQSKLVPSVPGTNTCLGHHTALLEDYATRIGCALRASRNAKKLFISAALVCNLNRANVNELTPYQISLIPASGCQKGRNYIHEFLCKPDEEVDNNYVPSQTEAEFRNLMMLQSANYARQIESIYPTINNITKIL